MNYQSLTTHFGINAIFRRVSVEEFDFLLIYLGCRRSRTDNVNLFDRAWINLITVSEREGDWVWVRDAHIVASLTACLGADPERFQTEQPRLHTILTEEDRSHQSGPYVLDLKIRRLTGPTPQEAELND